ncbi:MAG: ACT domain-containing protein [Fusobacterium sp.]
MKGKYLIVSKKILPDYYEKVIEARRILELGKTKSVSEAVKMVGISRSTYYKYKDDVFLPCNSNLGKKALVSLMLEHKRGVLSEVINYLSTVNGNIITINQNMPINNSASVIISLDISDINIPIEEIIVGLKDIKDVISAKLISLE